ncbi:hypothetical protein LRHMDP2_1786 [Lacticaseibacillus rhamnosus LRHMDP2]|uniref:Uncharacterized protein n=1 Tax=Lacticaseibacillus rhamnosus LRHMDP3 TaxID=1203259 RepID=A0AB33XWZ2_LACRH|nr:hypothetical protein LRHMDP2_1786 [Lacticaseibacillus rhamnosus LRHMDP2]EKS52389.1 hypothetical protein LRHMDP3_760 [Lacticaseibacillus rhamnosus LRHMDP3]
MTSWLQLTADQMLSVDSPALIQLVAPRLTQPVVAALTPT